MYYDYDEPHWVYQIHGRFRFSRTLYIGETNSVPRRMSQHRRQKDWWPDDGRISWRQYPDRVSALAAEEAAIRRKQPVHNIKHNGRVEVSIEADVELSGNGLFAMTAMALGVFLMLKWGSDAYAVRRARTLALRQGIEQESPRVANPFTENPLGTPAKLFYTMLVMACAPPPPRIVPGDPESMAALDAWQKAMAPAAALWAAPSVS